MFHAIMKFQPIFENHKQREFYELEIYQGALTVKILRS